MPALRSFLKEEVRRASQLGIKNVVLHPGASVSYTREESIKSIIDGLNLILDNNLDVVGSLEVGGTFNVGETSTFDGDVQLNKTLNVEEKMKDLLVFFLPSYTSKAKRREKIV